MKRAFLIAALFAIVGCGGDTGPATANLAGTWTYATSNLVGAGVTCSSSGTLLTLNQSGTTFSGSYSGGTLTCSAPGVTPQSVLLGSGIVVSGNAGVTTVSFNLDTSDWANTGTIAGNSMSGTTHVTLNDGTTTVTLSGNFAAARN
jgi:hypothetical protein